MTAQIDTSTLRLIACSLHLAQRIESMGNSGAMVNKIAAFDRRHNTHFSHGWDRKGTQDLIDRFGTGLEFNLAVRRTILGQIFNLVALLLYGLQQESA